jgi:inorganic pyrophosphatase/exopolyphosphatase
VYEVFDHHQGFETFWQSKVSVTSRIEPIGAAATLIWERVLELGAQNNISQGSAKAVAYAIASNTVGLTLPLTTSRDRRAMADAAARAGLRDGWMNSYFRGVDIRIQNDLWGYLKRDTKLVRLWNHLTVPVGQLELSSASETVEALALSNNWSKSDHGIIIITSRNEGKTYVYSVFDEVHFRIGQHFSCVREGTLTVVKGIVLRKMILPLVEDISVTTKKF